MQTLQRGCIDHCPACPHSALSFEESLARKQQWLLKRLEGFADMVEPIRGVDENQRWHYRSKVCLAAAFNGQDWQIGIRKRDEVIGIPDCPIHEQKVNRNIQLLCRIMPPSDHFPLYYYMQSNAQVTLVVKSKSLPDLGWLDHAARIEFERNGVEGFWLHLHPSAGRKVIGKGGWHLLFGRPHSEGPGGVVYGPASFTQVMQTLHQHSLMDAGDFLHPTNHSLVIDLYCGIGSTLVQWLAAGAQCAGVELSGEALECAAMNASKAILLRGTCAQRIPQLSHMAGEARLQGLEILLYVNPPRTGLEKEVTSWIASELKPERMAYLSCSAGTLHRDLIFFRQNGLKLKRIHPYDFFPNTLHLEMLALLSKD